LTVIETSALVLLCGLSAYVMGQMVPAAVRQHRRRQWARLDARVIEAGLERRDHDARLRYLVAFTWQGVPRQALCREVEPDSRWHTQYGLDYRVQKVVDGRVARYPAGSAIPVMVNPANPDEVYLVGRELPMVAIASLTALVLVGLIAATVSVLFLPAH